MLHTSVTSYKSRILHFWLIVPKYMAYLSVHGIELKLSSGGHSGPGWYSLAHQEVPQVQHLSIYLFIHRSIYIFHIFIYWSFYLSIYLSFFLSFYPPIFFIYLSNYWDLFIYLSIYLSSIVVMEVLDRS